MNRKKVAKRPVVTNRSAALRSKESRKVVLKLEHLPEEVLLKIFRYLNLGDLLNICSIHNKKWYKLASDNSLWKPVFEQRNKDNSIIDQIVPGIYMKYSLRRNLFSPYPRFLKTKDSLSTEKLRAFIKKSGITFDMNVHERRITCPPRRITCREIDVYPSASSLRWQVTPESPIAPHLDRVKRIDVIANVPKMYDHYGSAIQNSPVRRTLLMRVDNPQFTTITKDIPEFDLGEIADKFYFAKWKDTQDIAFVILNIINESFITNCYTGSMDIPVVHFNEKMNREYIESRSQNFSFSFHLRDQKSFYVHDHYTSMSINKPVFSMGSDRIELLLDTKSKQNSMHRDLLPMLKWRAGSIVGKLSDTFILDFDLRDQEKSIWCISALKSAVKIENTSLNFDEDCEFQYEIVYKDDIGTFTMHYYKNKSEIKISHMNLVFNVKKE